MNDLFALIIIIVLFIYLIIWNIIIINKNIRLEKENENISMHIDRLYKENSKLRKIKVVVKNKK